MSFRRLCAIAGLLGLAVGLIGLPAIAQTTSNVEGTVVDSNGGPLPGASVELKSPQMQGTRVAVTDAAGRFRFPAVPPGTYSLTVSLTGFSKFERTNIRLALSETATVPVTMKLAVTQAIVVSAEAPVVDTTTTTAGTNYTAKVISSLPVGRNYADIVRAQPGVQEDNGETQGRSLALSIYGSTSAENLFLIDGVNTTNVIKGFQGKTINNEFVEEVEVKTGGYQAEYGRNTGGVVNVITKQGGNEFHGNVFGYFDNASTRGDIKVVTEPPNSQAGDVALSSTLPTNTRWDYGLSLGGYFWKDRIWFFGAVNRLDLDQEIQPETVGQPTYKQRYPGTQKGTTYSGKLTFNITSSTNLVASVFSDPQTNDGYMRTPTNPDPNTWEGTRDLGGLDLAIKGTQLFGSTAVLDVQYSKHRDKFLFTPFSTIPQYNDQTTIVDTGVATLSGGWGSVFGPTQNNESSRDSYRGAMQFFFGGHEIKVGGDYQKDVTTGATYYTSGQRIRIYECTQRGSSVCDLSKAPTYTNSSGRTMKVFYRHDFFTPSGTNLTPMASSPFETPNKLWSVFIQDQWKILPNLTVNLGVRYDDQKVYKGNNEIAFDLKDQWSPRLGFSWDPLKDGSSKVYGSYGRFHYATPTDLNVRVFTANTQVYQYNYNSTALGQDPTAPRKQNIQIGSFEGEPVDAGLKAAYQDEYTFGLEKAFDPTFSVGAKFTYRSLGRTIEDRCDLDSSSPLSFYNSCAIFNPGGDGPAASGQVPTCNNTGNPTDPTAGECFSTGVAVPAAKRIFRGFELTAKKRFGDALWVQASYLYSMLKGNYAGAISTASGQTDPGINADYDYYQFYQQNNYGLLELDRPHSFRMDGAYTFPFGLNLGLSFRVRSGVPVNKQGWFNDFYTTELYLVERGSYARTPTEWEGDFRLGYDWKIGPVTVTPMVYIYNMFNNQIVNSYDGTFNPNGSFVTNDKSKYYGQAGVEPGTARPDGTICPAGGAPCSDNPNFMKADNRTNPRVFRFAVRVSF